MDRNSNFNVIQFWELLEAIKDKFVNVHWKNRLLTAVPPTPEESMETTAGLVILHDEAN